jgi:DNA modification methylase
VIIENCNNRIFIGDNRVTLDLLPPEIVHTTITSPPYYAKRDYDNPNQIGLEHSPEEYIEELLGVFRKVRRVTRKDGTLWIVIDDTSFGSGKARNDKTLHKYKQGTNAHSKAAGEFLPKIHSRYLKKKDLIGIPWLLATALRDDGADIKGLNAICKVITRLTAAYGTYEGIPDKVRYVLEELYDEYDYVKGNGWYLRSEIIWNKPATMPESVIDRPTHSHEIMFLLSKNSRYYYDAKAIKTDIKDLTVRRMLQDVENQSGTMRQPFRQGRAMKPVLAKRKNNDQSDGKLISGSGSGVKGHSGYFDKDGNLIGDGKANKRDVWTVTVKGFRGNHFAIYPPDLITDCIKSGSPVGGIVLDPFFGRGTTGVEATRLNRNYVGCELNKGYIPTIKRYMMKELGVFFDSGNIIESIAEISHGGGNFAKVRL